MAKKKTSAVTWILAGLGWVVIGVFLFTRGGDDAPREVQQAVTDGSQCLSGWDGSHRGFKQDVRQAMNNPKSFDHVRTDVSAVNSEGFRDIRMFYRAENGFGATITSSAFGRFRASDCAHIVTNYEE